MGGGRKGREGNGIGIAVEDARKCDGEVLAARTERVRIQRCMKGGWRGGEGEIIERRRAEDGEGWSVR